MQLLEEGATDEAGAHQANANRQRVKVEAAMHSAQSADRVLLVDQTRDVVLAAALSNGPA